MAGLTKTQQGAKNAGKPERLQIAQAAINAVAKLEGDKPLTTAERAKAKRDAINAARAVQSAKNKAVWAQGIRTVDILIADIPKNNRDITRIQLREYKGSTMLDIRQYFPNANGEFCPTS
jgi:hypothetical protein